jgi:hypothetical protein
VLPALSNRNLFVRIKVSNFLPSLSTSPVDWQDFYTPSKIKPSVGNLLESAHAPAAATPFRLVHSHLQRFSREARRSGAQFDAKIDK